jgi:predicted RNase H-like nuclease (RuvC/YqgF family)
VKIINEEIDESQTNIASLRKKVEDETHKFNELAQRRDSFVKSWKQDKSLNELHMEVLHLMLRESIQIVENMQCDTMWQKGEVKIKIRDMQINKLRE